MSSPDPVLVAWCCVLSHVCFSCCWDAASCTCDPSVYASLLYDLCLVLHAPCLVGSVLGLAGWVGLNWIGLDWIGLDWIGLDWIGLGWVMWVLVVARRRKRVPVYIVDGSCVFCPSCCTWRNGWVLYLFCYSSAPALCLVLCTVLGGRVLFVASLMYS